MAKVKTGSASGKTCKPIHTRLIPVEQIDNGPHPWDVRGDDNHGHVQRLARSLEMNGGRLEHPIVVRPHPTDHGKFERISGSCRLLAATSNGRAEIPAVIRELSDKQARLVALTENMGRQAPRCLLKLGWVILPLLEETGSKQKDLAELIGCQESKISDALKYARMISEETAEEIAVAAGISKDVIGGLTRQKLKSLEELNASERTQALTEICRPCAEDRGVSAVERSVETVPAYEVHSEGQAISVSISDVRSLTWFELLVLFRELFRICLSVRRNGAENTIRPVRQPLRRLGAPDTALG